MYARLCCLASHESSITKPSSYSLAATLTYKNCSIPYLSFVNNVAHYSEPSSVVEAVKNSDWCEAMITELNALERNNTWTIQELPAEQSVVTCKWLFKLKFKSDGTLDRHKAMLVARGFTQIEGLDYSETFAPIARMITIRTLLSVAAATNGSIVQMDVTNAFLHGDLEEEVFMTLPPAYSFLKRLQASSHGELSQHCSQGEIFGETNGSSLVCKLNKSLYGLKQAPR